MKMTSEKKLAANRRNAMKSTGPKTAQGKAVVSRNALKFGMLAEAVVVRGHVVKESAREYEQLCREFHESLAPLGMLEEMLTGQIAAVAWRLRRVRKAESGEIALSVDEGQKERSQVNPKLVFNAWDLSGNMVRAMEESTMGNRMLISWLKDVKEQVQKQGKLTEESVAIPCAGKPNSMSHRLEDIRLALAKKYEGGADPKNAEKEKSHTLELIDDMILEKNIMREACEKREQVEETARQSAAVLPKEEALGKIMRYESALERQLFRAMNHLERLQERRLKNAGQEALPEKLEIAKQSQIENAAVA
ncbi:MAG TPA: hypothetical protein VK815_13125 [Candidatus Acidoferrales bacterium]|jgi:hypothetical protein|nr:hypothetical protein [Candidatus Acidoferrales bacterium]